MPNKPARRKKASKEVNAIQVHLDGTIETSKDHGKTWVKFEGMIVNAALIEYKAEIDFMREQGMKISP